MIRYNKRCLYVVRADATRHGGGLHDLTAEHVLRTRVDTGDVVVRVLDLLLWAAPGTPWESTVPTEATLSLDGFRVERHAGRGASLGEDGLEDAFGGDALPELVEEILGPDHTWSSAPVALVVDDEAQSQYRWRRSESGQWTAVDD